MISFQKIWRFGGNALSLHSQNESERIKTMAEETTLTNDNTNEDDNSLFEGMKNNLLSYLISLFGVENNISKGIFFYREICDLLSEYIEGSKNCIDYFMNDNLLCILHPINLYFSHCRKEVYKPSHN